MNRSTNVPTKNRTGNTILNVAKNGEWKGPNVTPSVFGFDDQLSGKPFGKDEFGGLEHFGTLKNG